MKLYFSPGACSLASHIVLQELKQPTELVKVDIKAHKTERGDDYYAINPKGYVPALVLEDGELLTENIAVLQYLASRSPSLLPQEGKAKWHAIETLGFVSTEIHKAFKPMFDPSSSDEAKQKAKDLVAKRLQLLVPKLERQAFITGDTFSVVDAYLFVMLTWSKKQGVEIPTQLQDYAAKLGERESVKAALAAESEHQAH